MLVQSPADQGLLALLHLDDPGRVVVIVRGSPAAR
jgi:hypothetical protein